MNWNLLDEQWRNRGDAAQFAELENALDRALYNQKEPEYALLWRWARLEHFRAMRDEANVAGAKRHFAAGAQEAKTAVALQPNRVEGHFWCGVCEIEAARLQNKLAAFRVLSGASKHIDRAAQIDESYHFAGPLRVQARMRHLRPILLGGSLDTALEMYRRALQIAPHNSTTLLYYADALLANQERPQARHVLQQILDAPPDPDWKWEQKRDQKIAARKLQEISQNPPENNKNQE